MYSISDLAAHFEISHRTLRFYESKGLVNPKRQGVNRIYSDKDKVCLELALRGKRIGLSLEEIKEIIEMYNPRQSDDARQLLFLLQKINTKRRELINKFNDLSETLNAMDLIEERVLAALGKRSVVKAIQNTTNIAQQSLL